MNVTNIKKRKSSLCDPFFIYFLIISNESVQFSFFNSSLSCFLYFRNVVTSSTTSACLYSNLWQLCSETATSASLTMPKRKLEDSDSADTPSDVNPLRSETPPPPPQSETDESSSFSAVTDSSVDVPSAGELTSLSHCKHCHTCYSFFWTWLGWWGLQNYLPERISQFLLPWTSHLSVLPFGSSSFPFCLDLRYKSCPSELRLQSNLALRILLQETFATTSDTSLNKFGNNNFPN